MRASNAYLYRSMLIGIACSLILILLGCGGPTKEATEVEELRKQVAKQNAEVAKQNAEIKNLKRQAEQQAAITHQAGVYKGSGAESATPSNPAAYMPPPSQICLNCKGSGSVDERCARCFGTGKIECHYCKGKGVGLDGKKCGLFRCNGRGWNKCVDEINLLLERVPGCDGKGTLSKSCKVCRGTGKVN